MNYIIGVMNLKKWMEGVLKTDEVRRFGRTFGRERGEENEQIHIGHVGPHIQSIIVYNII
jgi:hypothetical protein